MLFGISTRIITLFLCYFLFISLSLAQSEQLNFAENKPIITVQYTNETIHLDGILSETVWHTAKKIEKFAQNFPIDSVKATHDTEIQMVYNNDFLYVAIKCQAVNSEFIIPSLRRDYDFFGNDNITLIFDTYNDRTNALVFGINPYGVQREATITNAGQKGSDFDDSWDNKWQSAAQIHGTSWTAEMAIPFKTLRYKAGATSWRFNAYRYDTQDNEISSWISIPRNRFTIDLGFMGEMHWEKPLQKPSRNISMIPYISSSILRNYEDVNENKAMVNFSYGGDAKVSLTAGLNLDLTINPDFSQVEVDQQVTNLSQFEVMFPERRQFFLENADLFGKFGANRLNPFFSRRIGVAIDTATGQNIQNKIIYGARLSGKINEQIRIGVLNMQTAAQIENDLPSFNYAVGVWEQRIKKHSTLRGIFVNKQAVDAENFGGSFNSYNRTVGLEYRFNSNDNKLTGRSSFQKTFTPNIKNQTDAHITQVIYNERRYRFEWVHQYLGAGYNPEVGFAPRRDILMLSPEASINFYPENKKIGQHTLGFDASLYWKMGNDGNSVFSELGLQELNIEPFWTFQFANSSSLTLKGIYTDLTLLQNFDPTRLQTDDIFLPAGSSFRFGNFCLDYSSDQRKKFTYNFSPVIGSFYNGFRAGLSGQFTYRYQPYGFIALAYNYNCIKLDTPFKKSNLWLIGPRFDITFTKKIFFTTFIQYNNQLNNLNVNARFQWRFKPVSDFFLVYTNNYLARPSDPFASRNRALVAKLTYWFNL